jgi:hypothetical protein
LAEFTKSVAFAGVLVQVRPGAPNHMTLSRFIAKWTIPDYPPTPVDALELAHVENYFGFHFPADYKTGVLRYGLPWLTASLLSTIVDRELGFSDMSNFLAPSEIVETTDGWHRLGLPSRLVSFATDCVGNLFCFDREECRHVKEHAQVWIFDHDFVSTEVVGSSFDSWIEQFCQIEL